MVEETSGKKRVNLYLDESLVQRCKDLGINMSRATSEILEGLPDSNSSSSESYNELFEKLIPFLKHYFLSIEVGHFWWLRNEQDEGQRDFPLLLHAGGDLSIEVYGGWDKSRVPDGMEAESNDNWSGLTVKAENREKFLESIDTTQTLHSPAKIFLTLLDEIQKKKDAEAYEVLEIEKIKRLLSAIEPTLLKENPRGHSNEINKSL